MALAFVFQVLLSQGIFVTWDQSFIGLKLTNSMSIHTCIFLALGLVKHTGLGWRTEQEKKKTFYILPATAATAHDLQKIRNRATTNTMAAITKRRISTANSV